jgi:hypothetical protein
MIVAAMTIIILPYHQTAGNDGTRYHLSIILLK